MRPRSRLWLSLLFALLIVPGVMAVAWVARRGAPWLALAGGVVSLAAFTAGSTLPNVDLAAYVAGQRGLDATALNDAVMGHPTVTGRLGFFLVGQAVGLVLLGLALWRSRAVPAWAAACLAVSGPAHLVGGVGGNAVAAATWALTAVGFVGASVALLRQSDDAFDLPPGADAAPATAGLEATGDARTVWRVLLAVTAPLAALGVTIGRYLLPYDVSDPAEVIFDKLVAATTFQAWAIWLGGPLSLVACAGVVAVAWLSRRGAPVLTTIAVLLALPGYLALTAGGPYGDLLAYAVGHRPDVGPRRCAGPRHGPADRGLDVNARRDLRRRPSHRHHRAWRGRAASPGVAGVDRDRARSLPAHPSGLGADRDPGARPGWLGAHRAGLRRRRLAGCCTCATTPSTSHRCSPLVDQRSLQLGVTCPLASSDTPEGDK